MSDVFNFDDILSEAAKSGNGDFKDAIKLNGNFNVEVSYANAKTRKSDGSKANPTIGIKFTVLDGPLATEESWFNITLTDKSKGMFGRTLLSMGVPEDFLRSLGTASGEEGIKSALDQIAQSLVMARYNVNVGPNPKNPQFEQWDFAAILQAPDIAQVSAPAPVASGITTAPAAAAPLAAAPAPQVGAPGIVAATAPMGVPGGFVPQLTN